MIASLPEPVSKPDRFKPQAQAFKQAPPRDLRGLWIALLIILVGGGGTVAALYFLQLGPFAPPPIKHTVFPTVRPVVKRQIVELKSKPLGASIELNGNPTPFKTPYKLKLAAEREHKIVLKLGGYKDYEHKLKIAFSKKPLELDFKLEKQELGHALKGPKGVLYIECWPVGANINIGLRNWGKCTKGTVRIEIPGGTHPTKISFPGYDPYTESMTIPADEVTNKKIILQKSLPGKRRPAARRKTRRRRPARRRIRGSGELSIACQPAADVFWRGKKIGRTPLKHKFPAGRQRLVLKNSSLGAQKNISIYVKPRKVIAKKFSFQKGKIKFIIKPWADVTLDGKKIGQTPIPPAKVYEGFHTVILKHKSKKKRFRFRVVGGSTYPVFHAFP